MRRIVLAAAAAAAPTLALAHAGASDHLGFAAGLAHPLGGLDHVAAMVAVGLWAAMVGGRARWAYPLAFVAAMVAGGALGGLGLAPWGVEHVIVASVILLGALAALSARAPLALALPLIALFGAAHGAAHGLEGPAGGAPGYTAGFALATASLHGAGLALGVALMRGGAWAARAAGAATAATGVLLAAN